ncbi:hypothetical protein LCGC14_2096650, partial [marine sediment metagenome]
MNINTNTWHYRLVNRVFDMYFVNNLCPYMRRLIGILAIMFIGVPSVLFGMAETIVLIMKGREFLDIWLATFGGVFHAYGIVCAIFGIVAWLVVTAYLLLTLTLYVVGKVNNALENNQSYQAWRLKKATKVMSPHYREPNIFIQWCKARHDQV